VADLCQALRPITENDDRIHLETKMEDGILVDADTAVPLGIVLTELITNAVKYAFPAPRSGTILVQARRSQPGAVELVVRDDGIGISQLRDGSLGYGLVRSLVQQIRGEIDIRNEAGLVVTLSFPEAFR
jgi:two-component sensor histidine kinase